MRGRASWKRSSVGVRPNPEPPRPAPRFSRMTWARGPACTVLVHTPVLVPSSFLTVAWRTPSLVSGDSPGGGSSRRPGRCGRCALLTAPDPRWPCSSLFSCLPRCRVWKALGRRKLPRKSTSSANTIAAREAPGQDGAASFQGRRARPLHSCDHTAVPDHNRPSCRRPVLFFPFKDVPQECFLTLSVSQPLSEQLRHDVRPFSLGWTPTDPFSLLRIAHRPSRL